MQSQIANTGMGPIEFTLLGSGPVVFVCHGTSSNCFSVNESAPLLEAGFRVLTPSRPGYGRTPSKVGTSAGQAAEAFIALLDCLEIKTCAIVAISGGGPSGVALAASHPERVSRLALVEAITRTADRMNEPAYPSQKAFYGPLHGIFWNLLGLISRLSPTSMARQTMSLFSTHDPDEVLHHLTPKDIEAICRFYQGRSSRAGALNDFAHTVEKELLQSILAPTLVIHSREDKSVPFSHAEWSLAHIPNSKLCESGLTGHFYWVGPDYQRVSQELVSFLGTAV
ncbi:MAG TPA: alpha/beta hydrolase [Anaerolineales bacterium]|nr:alpha/beta hydrolase [Anaerolineales bacterium]